MRARQPLRDPVKEVVGLLRRGLMPFFSSAEAAEGWQANHPDGHVFIVSQAWEMSLFRDWRDRVSTLLNLDH